jgi:ABC-type glycerol-3-phosphate transport system substrate-binding protein
VATAACGGDLWNAAEKKEENAMSDAMTGGTPTRRQLLKSIAATGVLASTSGLLSACSKSGSGGSSSVTLMTHDNWPYGAMPSTKEQKADPSKKAYAEALQEWLDKNPGVTIKNSALDVWNQQALTTAISGGTAPAAYPGDVMGGWDRAAVRGAMLQGLSADVTEHLKANDIESKLADYAMPIWEKWAVDGKFFAAPWIYTVGTGIHYRIDLIRELGLKEPTPDWTWDDVRELAKGLTSGKRKGIVLQGWGVDMGLNADGMDFLSQVPAPDTGWNWRWDYSARADLWQPLIERARAMIYEDKTVRADVSMADGDALAAFARGDVAMHNNTVIFLPVTPGGDNAPANLAKKLDKPFEEVFGWMSQPNGRNGRTSNTQGQVDLVAFSPDLDEDQLDKAVSLLFHMQGPGYVHTRQAVFETSKDAKRVYDWENIMPLRKDVTKDLPSSPDEAWGEPFMDEVRRAAQIPLVPNDSWYFPAEANPGPTETAREDMRSRWANERGRIDVRADLAKLSATRNKQAASFTSSTSDEDFVKAAEKYYDDHAEYWRTNAPEYYENVFKEWHESVVRPALKG